MTNIALAIFSVGSAWIAAEYSLTAPAILAGATGATLTCNGLSEWFK